MNEVEVTIENVIGMLLCEKFKLMTTYHLRPDDITGFALGPNEWLILREQLQKVQQIPELKATEGEVCEVAGMRIYVTPHPGILPLFGKAAWYVAIEESRKRYSGAMDA